jgi:transposase-like protein
MSSLEQRRLASLELAIRGASGEQIVAIERLVAEVASVRVADVALARRTEATVAARRCPHCRTDGAHLHGKDKNGRQRFRCREAGCRRTFNILTGTPMARARKPEKWGRYLGHMTDHLSVRRIVEAGIGVNHTTVWRWRHRFLKAASQDNAAVLSGVIEADETFFVRSFKGHRGWTRGRPPADRAARPSAWGALKPPLGAPSSGACRPSRCQCSPRWTARAGSTRPSYPRWRTLRRRWTGGSPPGRWSARMAPWPTSRPP